MDSTTSASQSSNPMLGAIAVRRRRLVLAILRDRISPLAERELATHLAAEEREKPLVAVTSEEVAEIHADLHHVHLPRLSAASLVERDAEAGTVTTTNHPALDDPHLERIIETDEDGWDAVLASLASQRRRTVLAALEDSEGPMAREDLAATVRRREAQVGGQGTGAESPADAATDILVSLHHTHLPKLDEAGLVTYDVDEGTIIYEGHPALETEWLAFAPDETPLTVLPAARESPDIWTIEVVGTSSNTVGR